MGHTGAIVASMAWNRHYMAQTLTGHGESVPDSDHGKPLYCNGLPNRYKIAGRNPVSVPIHNNTLKGAYNGYIQGKRTTRKYQQ